MAILMKRIIFLIFSFIQFLSAADNYTFLVKEYNKEIELEAKIISNIAQNLKISNEKMSIFIPQISETEKNIYSGFFNISNSCENADFIFVKNEKNDYSLCNGNHKIFFTNSYDSLLKNKQFIGAFFWSKSRPNVIFVKDRLIKNHIELPEIYNKFVEEF
jgi:hypothetical protein